MVRDADGVTRCGPRVPPLRSFAPTYVPPRLEGFAEESPPALPPEPPTTFPDPVRELMRQRHRPILACYQQLLAREPGVGGDLYESFQVDRAGAVGNVAIRGFDATVDACVCEQILAFAVPAGARFDERAVVDYPLVFMAGQ